MKMWTAAMALVAMLPFTTVVAAQDAPTQIALNVSTPGDAFAYQYTMRLNIEQQMGERALEPQSVANRFLLNFTVRQVDESGNAELAMRIGPGSIVIADGSGGDVRKHEISIPSPPLVAAGDEAAMAQSNFAKSIETAMVTFTVTPLGDVMNVSGLEPVVEALSKLETPDPRLLGPLAPGQLELTLESIFGAEGAAGQSQRVSSGWQNTHSVDVPPVAVLNFTDDVKLESVDGGIATMTTKGSVGVRRPSAEDPTRPVLGIEDFSSSAKTLWDVKTGRLRSRHGEMSMSTTWKLAEVDLHQKQTVSVVIELAR